MGKILAEKMVTGALKGSYCESAQNTVADASSSALSHWLLRAITFDISDSRSARLRL